MRPRWQSALLYLTLPIWFVPGMLWIGWDRAGRDTIKEIPIGLRWVIFGKEPWVS